MQPLSSATRSGRRGSRSSRSGREVYRAFATPAVFDPITVSTGTRPTSSTPGTRGCARPEFPDDDWSRQPRLRPRELRAAGLLVQRRRPDRTTPTRWASRAAIDPQALAQVISRPTAIGRRRPPTAYPVQDARGFCQQRCVSASRTERAVGAGSRCSSSLHRPALLHAASALPQPRCRAVSLHSSQLLGPFTGDVWRTSCDGVITTGTISSSACPARLDFWPDPWPSLRASTYETTCPGASLPERLVVSCPSASCSRRWGSSRCSMKFCTVPALAVAQSSFD